MPPALEPLEAGEAVLVEYGRRQALGVVMGEATDQRAPASGGAVDPKAVLERVRSDGPLLPPLGVRLARHISEHYLAPPALVVRAMVPPGLLERLELRARIPPEVGESPGDGTIDRAQLEAVRAAGGGGIPVRDLPSGGDRPAAIRRLRAAQRAGLVVLEWTLVAPTSQPRLERRAALTDAGREAAALCAVGERPSGARLGPRQRALLEELAAPDAPPEEAAARLAQRHGASALTGLAARGLVRLTTAVRGRRPLAGRAVRQRGARPSGTPLSNDQAALAARITAASIARRTLPVLLDGVTASGKTAVYAAVIQGALAAGRAALVLVPEIALALPLVDRLRAELPQVADGIALLHSGLSDGERADEWRRIRVGEATVVVGTRLAVLAPLADPGVVVVDEEHDASYKSDRTPRFQARDVALVLGELACAPVVLGSATPDVVSIGRAQAGGIERVRLAERLVGRAPDVELVDLRAELANGNRSPLSGALVAAIGALDRSRGDRAILAINRRGSASVVLCRDCGYVQICPDCRRPLVFHASGSTLRCHHCGASAPVARRCPACASARIRYLGGGTERVESEVRARFPELRVARLDRDVVERRGAAARVVDDFTDGEIDVLVGTSLVTKGLDVPQVTLVGVVSADVALNLPDERAVERTYQMLVQAVGRAGRGERPGHAIVQTYQPDHPAIRALIDDDPEAFYDAELAARRAFGSPPFGTLVKLTIAHEDHETAERRAGEMAQRLRERAADAGGITAVLGPAPAYVARRGGRWRFHVILRGADPLGVLGGDPGSPWSIDVDPESLL